MSSARSMYMQRGWIDADSRQAAKANSGAQKQKAANSVLVCWEGGGLHVAKPFLVQMVGFRCRL
jgi:hypothetical protein